MATKTAKIIQTKHKGKDCYVLDLGKTRVEKRYKSTRNAAFGAVRANKEWCMSNPYNNVVRILYPDGRQRIGGYWSIGISKVHLQEFTTKRRK